MEHGRFSEKLKNSTNQTGVIDVDVFPEEIRVSQNPSLNPTNTVLRAQPISMQSKQGTLHHGLAQQGSLQQHRELLQHLGQQVFGKQG